MNGVILIILFLLVAGVAYTFVVLFPLFGVVLGAAKIPVRAEKKCTIGRREFVKYENGLGLTMADGGEEKVGDN